MRLGQAAYDRGDQETALAHWKTGAESGEARAQNKLATLYEAGLGGERDDAKAIKWYTRAARQGLPEARANLERLGQRVPAAYPSASEAFAANAVSRASQVLTQVLAVPSTGMATGSADAARALRCLTAYAACVNAIPEADGTPEQRVAMLSCQALLGVCR